MKKIEKDTTESSKNTHYEDISVFNICTPNTRAPKFVKQTLLQFKSQIEKGNINIPLSLIEWSSRQKTKQMNSELIVL